MRRTKTHSKIQTEDKSKFLGLTAAWWMVVLAIIPIVVTIWLAFRNGSDTEREAFQQQVQQQQAQIEKQSELINKCLAIISIVLDKDNPPPVPDCFDTVEIAVKNAIEQGGYVSAADLLKVANVLFTKGNLLKAMSYYEVALDQAEQRHDSTLIAVAKGNIGLIYSDQGDLATALNYLQEALELHKEIGYRQGEASTLGNIGLIYKAQGDLAAALKYHQQALAIHKEVGYRQGEASQLGNIGLIYKAQGNLAAALKYLQEALELHEEIGYRQGEASTLGNIGLIYSDQGDLAAALKYLTEALSILDEHGLKYGRDIIVHAIDEIKQKQKE
ncbi:MAG TPA: tetratricopeptide repeat protein [Candidatus Deferrimicrobium sp.]|nr:tetratricopeptide repeat protein [Candidatus Deferrimicrobium sp.]